MTWSLSRRENWIMVCEGGLNEIMQKELIRHAWDVQSQGLGTLTTLCRSRCCTCAHAGCAALHIPKHQHRKMQITTLRHANARPHIHTWPTFICQAAVGLIPSCFSAFLFAEMVILFLFWWHCFSCLWLCNLLTNVFTVLACLGFP